MVNEYPATDSPYVGMYSVADTETGHLLHGGGIHAPRPRLYDTAAAAIAAADSILWCKCEPVLLVAAK
tara:strand:+ start:1131 stop:1334 length:204 start_codon:yes stop_codon:yes gene_type:complete